MRDWDPTISRSVILADRISRRTDEAVRVIVHQFERDLCFQPIEDHMISQAAWGHVASAGYEPHHVFAHHEMLIDVPHVSAYYRNMAMLPLKRVSDLAVGVERWEDLESESRITVDRAKKVARLYNAVNSSIIEGKTDWTLQNGYRNMIANMGIGLDGTMRNIIGRDADMLLKTRMLEWLESHALIVQGDPFKGGVGLVGGYSMRYGSEPDIEFKEGPDVIATIEVKGGRDPAGALERLGAARKSFDATPAGCTNFLVAGVITHTMQQRLDEAGTIKVFLFDDVVRNGPRWHEFLNEVFHHTVRLTNRTIDDSY